MPDHVGQTKENELSLIGHFGINAFKKSQLLPINLYNNQNKNNVEQTEQTKFEREMYQEKDNVMHESVCLPKLTLTRFQLCLSKVIQRSKNKNQFFDRPTKADAQNNGLPFPS